MSVVSLVTDILTRVKWSFKAVFTFSWWSRMLNSFSNMYWTFLLLFLSTVNSVHLPIYWLHNFLVLNFSILQKKLNEMNLFSVYMPVWKHTWHGAFVQAKGQLLGVGSPLLSCGSQGSRPPSLAAHAFPHWAVLPAWILQFFICSSMNSPSNAGLANPFRFVTVSLLWW